MIALRRAAIEGALVVLPLGAVVLLVIGIVGKLRQAADPLRGSFLHPLVAAVLLLLLLCLVVGLLVRSRAGRQTRQALEASVLERLPGYRLIRAFASDGLIPGEGGTTPRPVLVSIEEGLCPAFVMDSFADGRLLVFVPGTPAPMSGTLYIFTPDRVTFLDVPLLPFMQGIASWGLGLREMIETQRTGPIERGRPTVPAAASGTPTSQ